MGHYINYRGSFCPRWFFSEPSQERSIEISALDLDQTNPFEDLGRALFKPSRLYLYFEGRERLSKWVSVKSLLSFLVVTFLVVHLNFYANREIFNHLVHFFRTELIPFVTAFAFSKGVVIDFPIDWTQVSKFLTQVYLLLLPLFSFFALLGESLFIMLLLRLSGVQALQCSYRKVLAINCYANSYKIFLPLPFLGGLIGAWGTLYSKISALHWIYKVSRLRAFFLYFVSWFLFYFCAGFLILLPFVALLLKH